MGAGGKDEQVGASAGAGDEFVSHLRREEAVAIALDDEDGKSAIAKGVLGLTRWAGRGES